MWNVAALLLIGCTCCTTCGAAPKGHLKVFGEHRPSEGEIHVVDEGITPEAFYRECVMPAKACMIRKVTQAWPGFAKWDNDSYLASEFGHFNVTVEGKREDTGGKGKMTLGHFIESEQSTGYVITEMPGPMFKDVDVPKCVRCGNLLEKCVEVNYWMSEGGTAGIMHKDPFNQLNCVVRGRKLWTIVDPTHIDNLPMVMEDGVPVAENSGGVVQFEFEELDLERFPTVLDVPYEQSWVEAGDCLYMPGSYIHQVTSPMGRNIQVSLLFEAHTALGKGFPHYGEPKDWDGASCAAGEDFADLTGKRPLGEHPVQWVYPGTGPQSMGLGDPARMRDQMVELFSGVAARSTTKRASVAEMAAAFAAHCSSQIRTDRALPLDDLAEIIESITLLRARGRWGINIGHGEEWNARKIVVVNYPAFMLPADFIPKLHSAAKRQATEFFNEASKKVGAREGFSVADLKALSKLEYKSGLLAHYSAHGIAAHYPFGVNVAFDKKRGKWVVDAESAALGVDGEDDEEEEVKEEEEVEACGHLQPLGMQCGDVTDVAVVDSSLSPRAFYHRFLKTSMAVLLRPAKQHTATPADPDTTYDDAPPPLLGRSVHDNWPSWDYLAAEFGNSEVSVDLTVKENRSGIAKEEELRVFLAEYKRKGWYMISPVPQEMAPRVHVPRVIATPQHRGLMQDVLLWINGQRSRSHLHFDNIQNMMCVVKGTKRFLLADKSQADRILIDVPRGDYSAVDVDAVDLAVYPGLRHVPWVRADVRAGECLYIPVNWFHQVASDEDTFGINFWWTAFDRGAPSNSPSNGPSNGPSNHTVRDQHLPPGNGQNDGLTADPAADGDPTGDGGDSDEGGHSKGGANAHAAYAHTLDQVEFAPAEQLRYQLIRYLQERAAPATEADMMECFLGEDTIEPILDGGGRGFHILDRDGDGMLTIAEVSNTPSAALHRAFPDFDAGALYVKCRSDLGWVRSNRGLIDLADLGSDTGADGAEPPPPPHQEL